MNETTQDSSRDKILQSAFCEIHKHGFQSASIADILAQTGLTKGALYHHFPTKHDLGLAVIGEVIHKRLDAWIFTPLRQSGRPLETLREIIRQSMQRTPEDVSLGCPLNNLIQEMSPLNAAFKEQLGAILTDWRRAVEDALTRSQRQGAIRSDIDCRASALFIVSAWEGCIGTAKNLQSADILYLCLEQLRSFISSLQSPQ